MRSRLASLSTPAVILALFAVVFAMSGAAVAGVATSGAVLLDPFDPVPEIQFHHFGGYGCGYGCDYTGCDDGCGGYRGCDYGCGYVRYNPCRDGCRRHYHRHHDCDDDCGDHDRRHADDRTCDSSHCYDAEHYERRWRDGDKVGQEWEDRGRRERMLPADAHPGNYYGRSDYDWHDEDNDDGPYGGVEPPPNDHDHHDDDHHDHH